MKVAFFTNAYLPYLSGITLSIKTLTDELRSLGHSVLIIGPAYPGYSEKDPRILRLLSFPATYPGYRFVLPYSYRIFSRLKNEGVDVVHAHQPFGVGTAARLLARKMGVPFVYSFHTLFSRYVHNVPIFPQNFKKLLVSRYLTSFCRKTDMVIAPSEMVRRLLVLRKIKTPIRVIPTGIVLNTLKEKKPLGGHRQKVREKHRIPAEARILLYSGRLSAEKNVPFLLKAFSRLSAQDKNVYFILVGGGPKEKELRALGQSAGNRVIFTGELPHGELLDYYFAADLFIYASVTETQGLVLTEAKACGLPVVAVFGGGISDVIESGTDGYLVPQNQDVFIEHVLRLLGDPELLKRMSLKAEEDARARFSSVVVAKEFESVYNFLISKRGGSNAP